MNSTINEEQGDDAWTNILYFILGSGLLATTSIMTYFAKTLYYQPQAKINPGNNTEKTNTKTIPALIFLAAFQILFVFFISFIISKKAMDPLNWIVKLSWGSVFISSIFQIISIFIVVICYKYINDTYLSKSVPLNFSDILKRELQDYNNLYVTVTCITVVFVAILLSNHTYLNSPDRDFFFQPYYYSILIYTMGTAILSMSSEMIKISNDFLSFKNNAAVSINR